MTEFKSNGGPQATSQLAHIVTSNNLCCKSKAEAESIAGAV